MSTIRSNSLNSIYATLACLSLVFSIAYPIYNTVHNSQSRKETLAIKENYYRLAQKVNVQQSELNQYKNGQQNLDFWDAYGTTFQRQEELGEKLVKNMGLAEVSLFVKYAPKNSEVYKKNKKVYLDEGLNHKELPTTSYPGAVMLVATNISHNSGLFIVKYQKIAKTLNIKYWIKFVNNNQKINKDINSTISELDMLTGELNQTLPVMPLNQ